LRAIHVRRELPDYMILFCFRQLPLHQDAVCGPVDVPLSVLALYLASGNDTV
jgi:hypothetical protein